MKRKRHHLRILRLQEAAFGSSFSAVRFVTCRAEQQSSKAELKACSRLTNTLGPVSQRCLQLQCERDLDLYLAGALDDLRAEGREEWCFAVLTCCTLTKHEKALYNVNQIPPVGQLRALGNQALKS